MLYYVFVVRISIFCVCVRSKLWKMEILYLFVALLLVQAYTSCSVDGRPHQHYNHHVHRKDVATDPLTASKLNVYPEQLYPGELHRSQFPKGFVFGSAGSAYQVGHLDFEFGSMFLKFDFFLKPCKCIGSSNHSSTFMGIHGYLKCPHDECLTRG